MKTDKHECGNLNENFVIVIISSKAEWGKNLK